MTVDEIKGIARQHHIKTGKAKKSELVWAIQQAEGNRPCFDSNSSATCGQDSCLWRPDCN
jgi:hypothetical protein